jgi:hypothetical protein
MRHWCPVAEKERILLVLLHPGERFIGAEIGDILLAFERTRVALE